MSEELTDYAWMRIHRSRYWHEDGGLLKARLDQRALGTDRRPLNYKPQAGTPTGEAAKLEAERTRRGLVWPDSWIQAGLRTTDSDF